MLIIPVEQFLLAPLRRAWQSLHRLLLQFLVNSIFFSVTHQQFFNNSTQVKERHWRRKSFVNCSNLIESKSVAEVLNWVRLRIGKFEFHIWDCCQCHTATNKNLFRKLIRKLFFRPKAAIWMNRFVNELKDKEKIDCLAETLYCLHWKKFSVEESEFFDVLLRKRSEYASVGFEWRLSVYLWPQIKEILNAVSCNESWPSRFNIFPQLKPQDKESFGKRLTLS